MINAILLLTFWRPANAAESNYFPIPLGKPVTHLHTFFEPRTLLAGDALFPDVAPVMPRVQAPDQPQPNEVAAGTVVAPKPRPDLQPKPLKTGDEKPASIDVAGTLVIPTEPKSTPAVTQPNLESSTSKTPTTIEAASTTFRLSTRLSPAPKVAAKAHEPMRTAKAGKPSKPPTKLEDIPVTINAMDLKLPVVLDLLMSETHTNLLLIPDPKATVQTVTLKATDRRFIDVLSDICALINLTYLKVGNEYVIASDDKLKASYKVAYDLAHPEPAAKVQEEYVTETYHTNYLDATKLETAITKTYKPEGLSMIVGPETPSPKIDSGVAAATTTGASGTSALQQDDIAKMSRIIILTGPQKAVDTAIDLFKRLDVQPAQVSIQVEVHDISITAANQLGLSWVFGSETFTENQPTGVALKDYVRTPLSFSATLSALQSNGADKLLARPNITVNDGQRGYVLVGDRIQYPVETGTSLSGTPIYSTQQQNVGIYLQVSAWITNDGKVTLNLYPQVSTVSGYLTVQGSQYPQISSRESQSTVTIENGKTFVIAGLIQDEDIVSMQGVPILDKLPFLKELFTFRSKTHTRNEVLITITPTILSH